MYQDGRAVAWEIDDVARLNGDRAFGFWNVRSSDKVHPADYRAVIKMLGRPKYISWEFGRRQSCNEPNRLNSKKVPSQKQAQRQTYSPQGKRSDSEQKPKVPLT